MKTVNRKGTRVTLNPAPHKLESDATAIVLLIPDDLVEGQFGVAATAVLEVAYRGSRWSDGRQGWGWLRGGWGVP